MMDVLCVNSIMQAETLLDIVNFGAKMFKHATDGVTLPCMFNVVGMVSCC